MKNRYSLFAIFFFFSIQVKAQLYPFIPEDETTIPGSGLTVSETIQQGKHVLIFAFDLTDDEGFNYLQSGILDQFYSTYGSNGTNEVEVVGMEGNILNTGEYLINYDPVISAGDWFAEADFPVRNNEYFSFHYGNVQLPSLIWLCPNGSMAEIGLTDLPTLESLLDTQCPDPLSDNLAISSLISSSNGCEPSFARFVNTGIQSSVEFDFAINVNGEEVYSAEVCCLDQFESFFWNVDWYADFGDTVNVTLN